MKKRLYIVRYRLLAVLLPILFAVAPVIAQNVVYQGETTTLSVEQQPGDSYVWELYNDSTVNFAQVDGVTSASYASFVGGNIGPTVQVEWKEPGTYFFRVMALSVTGCTTNLGVGKVKVIPSLPSATLDLDTAEICVGGTAVLEVTFKGSDPWNMKLQIKNLVDGTIEIKDYAGIVASDNPFRIPVSPTETTEYTVIEVSNKYGTQTDPLNAVTITVHPLPEQTPIYLKLP